MRFEPNVHTLVWGTESWEISAHPSSPSVIADGPDAGRTLMAARPGFPLLIKVITARTRLSVQVHPNERTAPLTGGEPKTEMWVMLDDGVIYAGLQPGVGPREVADAARTGAFEDILVRREARRGEAYFIPGGLVHAIGANTRIYEIQQGSNTTYRLHDWGRTGPDGRPRPLHVGLALKTIDYSLAAPQPQTDVTSPYFAFRQTASDAPAEVVAPPDSFLAVYEAGPSRSTLLDPGERLRVAAGRTFLTRLP